MINSVPTIYCGDRSGNYQLDLVEPPSIPKRIVGFASLHSIRRWVASVNARQVHVVVQKVGCPGAKTSSLSLFFGFLGFKKRKCRRVVILEIFPLDARACCDTRCVHLPYFFLFSKISFLRHNGTTRLKHSSVLTMQ